jgi:hypothetical protein
MSRSSIRTFAAAVVFVGGAAWAAAAHASTNYLTAASDLGATYFNTGLMPIGVPALSVSNAPDTFANLNPNVDYSYSTDVPNTNPTAGLNPDFHFLGSAGTIPGGSGTTGGAVWTFASLSKDYYLYETTDHGPLPNEGLEGSLYGSSDGGSTWSLGTVVEAYEQGWNLSGIPDDGATRWLFSSPVNLISAVVGLSQNNYSYHDTDYEIDAVMQVPEPTGFILAAVGLIGLIFWRRRKR